MNNNRNQNNRRRGRGNRNQGGGGIQSNRIDSRARGNAPQLLEKYRKLAEDAHRNGDRVQAEYYLQFADHYFRVLADARVRQDEQRGGEQRGEPRNLRRDERDGDEFDGGFDEESEDRARFEPREPQPRENYNREREPRESQAREREPRRERPRRDRGRDDGYEEGQADARPDGNAEVGEGPSFEPAESPFSRDARMANESREEAPRRRPGRPRSDRAETAGAPVKKGNGSAQRGGDEPASFDPSVLPPSFSAAEPAAVESAPGDETTNEKPAPRPRRKRSDGGTLSAVT